MSVTNGSAPKASSSVVRGRPFAKGNPGRQAGSMNRATRVAASLLEGEAEAIMRKGIERALAGDGPMLKFLLSRLLPRERTGMLDLPKLEFADDVVEAIAKIMRAVAEGTISPSEAVQLAAIVKMNGEAIELADVVKRLDALEAKIKSYG